VEEEHEIWRKNRKYGERIGHIEERQEIWRIFFFLLITQMVTPDPHKCSSAL
jgi:hypothetical protein